MGRKLGQIFLKDNNIIQKILLKSNISPTDTVLEIGCGDGILSEALANHCKTLHIIEIDPKCLETTRSRLAAFSNVSYHLNDILKVDLAQITPEPIRIIANIPYYLSAPLLKWCIHHRVMIKDMVLMFQKEFGQKLIAKPGSPLYTSFSIYFSYYYESTYLFTVSKNSFYPVPKIDSAVLHLTPNHHPPIGPLSHIEEESLFTIIRAAFWGRRKQLCRALKNNPYISLQKGFENVPFFQSNPKIRGEVLSLNAFYELFIQLKPYFLSQS